MTRFTRRKIHQLTHHASRKVSFGERCPQCSKLFKNSTSVLKHLNHPKTECSQSPFLSFPEPQNHSFSIYGQDTLSPMPLMPFGGLFGSESENIYDSDSSTPLFSNPSHVPIETVFPGSSKTFGRGRTFLEKFTEDEFTPQRELNLYYPFASRMEWSFAFFLSSSRLSMMAIDSLLSLEIMRHLPLSFRTAKTLQSRIEILPKTPKWTCETMEVAGYPTKTPLTLYYRNALDCVEFLFGDPRFCGKIDLHPRQVFKTAEKLERIYSEWMTCDSAWDAQSLLPDGATLLGTILSSDKTTITAMTGNRIAHPLLLSLANIHSDVRNKSSNNAFLLIALLPTAKFLYPVKSMRGPLENRLIHHCLDVICAPLKAAAMLGKMMADPSGYMRLCHTPLAVYIADSPEACMLAGVAGLTSHMTVANYKQFGDPFRHETRIGSMTLAQIDVLIRQVDPWDIEAYHKIALAQFRLNAIHQPFWRDWILSCPSHFSAQEPLHFWHKAAYDHDIQWGIHALGEREINFRYSVLQPRTGYRHFAEGIASIKQATGRVYRDIQRSFIPVLAGAAPRGVTIALRALMDFRYLSQMPVIDETTLRKIDAALQEFHEHKHHIINSGLRRGAKKNVLNHFQIPKLEFMQSVTASIRLIGPAIQWSADITEHCHITEVKVPARAGNNKHYETQICRYLDRSEKCRFFDMATSFYENKISLRVAGTHEEEITDQDPDDRDSGNEVLLVKQKKVTNYFLAAQTLLASHNIAGLDYFRTFCTQSTAFHLNNRADKARICVDEAARLFSLPDLRPALADHVARMVHNGQWTHCIGGRRNSLPNAPLPFKHVKVWYSVRMQMKAVHDMSHVIEPQRVHAAPPSQKWPHGQFETVLISNDSTSSWPGTGILGHSIAEVKLIFRPCWPADRRECRSPLPYLVYCERFDIIPQIASRGNPASKIADPVTGMYIVKRAFRADGSPIGDIIPLSRLRVPVQLVPRFGPRANRRLSPMNSFKFSSEFYLNKYSDKEIFHSVY